MKPGEQSAPADRGHDFDYPLWSGAGLSCGGKLGMRIRHFALGEVPESIDPPPFRASLEPAARQRVYCTLENDCRRMAVDLLRALGAAHILPEHGGFGAGSRPAFVPQQHR